MLHAFLILYVPNGEHGIWIWGLIKCNSAYNLHSRDGQLLYLIGWNSYQPNLVQPQSTAEVTAVPKMEEPHLILCCFWANASGISAMHYEVFLLLSLMHICLGVSVPSMHTNNVFPLGNSYLKFLKGSYCLLNTAFNKSSDKRLYC